MNNSQLLNYSSNVTNREWSSNRDIVNFALRAALITIGIFWNLLLILAVWNDRALRLGTRLLVINAALCAFLTMAVGQVGFNAYFYSRQSGACHVFIVNLITGTVANWAEVALAINRLVAVCYPQHYNRVASTSFGTLLCGLTWLIGASVIGFMGSGIGSSFREVQPGYCLPVITSAFGQFCLLMAAFVPDIAQLLLVLRITVDVFATRRSSAVVPAVPSPPWKTRGQKRKLRLLQAMVTSCLWCSCATLPWIVVSAFFPKALARGSLVVDALRLLYASEYAINPVGERLTHYHL